MIIARQALRCLLGQIDLLYRRWRRLEPSGRILLVGQEIYRGPERSFDDGTQVSHGDLVGSLHFNNRAFSLLDGRSPRAAALAFRRDMESSLQRLAERVDGDARWQSVVVFHGITWLPTHGQRVGFVTARYPDGSARRRLERYFRLLVWTFAAAEHSRRPVVDPHHYWLTRVALLRHFGPRVVMEERHAG